MSSSFSIHKPSHKEKKSWLDMPSAKETYIFDYAEYSRPFFESSCILTAAILRWRYNQKIWWRESPITRLSRKLLCDTKHTPIQIGFGVPYDYDHHILTIYDRKVYHSYYKKFVWEEKELPEWMMVPSSIDTSTDTSLSVDVDDNVDDNDDEIPISQKVLDELIGDDTLTYHIDDDVICYMVYFPK